MSQLAFEQTFRYPFPSQFDRDGMNRTLRLATFRMGKDSSPFFFEGRLANPQRTAELLRALMMVVQSRFHMPAAMLGRILAEVDPVVTANDDRLRFEGFSACCGAYARLDLLTGAFDGDVAGRGTTNVDFNQPILAALARVKRVDDVSLAVGADKVVLKQRATDVVEKKVKLPVRWRMDFPATSGSRRTGVCRSRPHRLGRLRRPYDLPDYPGGKAPLSGRSVEKRASRHDRNITTYYVATLVRYVLVEAPLKRRPARWVRWPSTISILTCASVWKGMCQFKFERSAQPQRMRLRFGDRRMRRYRVW